MFLRNRVPNQHYQWVKLLELAHRPVPMAKVQAACTGRVRVVSELLRPG